MVTGIELKNTYIRIDRIDYIKKANPLQGAVIRIGVNGNKIEFYYGADERDYQDRDTEFKNVLDIWQKYLKMLVPTGA